MERVQVAVSSIFNRVVSWKPKPNIHIVYNHVHRLHSCLQRIVSSETMRHLTDQRLNRKQSPAGPALYDIAPWKKNFLQVIEAATAKVWKCLFRAGQAGQGV
mmetsp:Transcript_108769/g.184433  ORF Transcript_108769/g.184433 Transcript_108769/m.184433 type:complete len:102 (-) Transcript_108769:424-729(-)